MYVLRLMSMRVPDTEDKLFRLLGGIHMYMRDGGLNYLAARYGLSPNMTVHVGPSSTMIYMTEGNIKLPHDGFEGLESGQEFLSYLAVVIKLNQYGGSRKLLF